MQDSIADKRQPGWLMALAETPDPQIEVLHRARRRGVVESTEDWLQAGERRNRLIHGYLENPEALAPDLLLAGSEEDARKPGQCR